MKARSGGHWEMAVMGLVAGDEPTGSLGERVDGVVGGKRRVAVGEVRVDVDFRLVEEWPDSEYLGAHDGQRSAVE